MSVVTRPHMVAATGSRKALRFAVRYVQAPPNWATLVATTTAMTSEVGSVRSIRERLTELSKPFRIPLSHA